MDNVFLLFLNIVIYIDLKMMGKEKIHFIFVGRLINDKGFDRVLEALKSIVQDPILSLKIHVHIFGDGPLRNKIPIYDFVSYYGFQEKEVVFETRKKCQYSLMPSRFLETFGLSALDSLSLGIPVIGERKGGLKQFVLPEREFKDNLLIEKIIYLVRHFDFHIRRQWSEQAKEIFVHYSKKQRIQRFQKLSGLEPGAKILLVSDYIVNIGGIESFLLYTKDLLEENGYEVQLIGCNDKWTAYNRLFALFGTFWNNTGAKLFRNTVKEFQPDLVWWNSIQRRFGPLVLYEARHCRARQRVMYHDFGLFHPYPSKVYEEKQIYHSSTFRGYIEEGISLKWWQMPLQVLKWVSSLLIKRQLRKIIHTHLVPSKYMEDMIYAHYFLLHRNQITTFHHFI